MKMGDLIECAGPWGTYSGLVIDVEMMYPSHPQSPPRNLTVEWVNGVPPYAFGPNRNKVSAFSVKVVSRG